MAFVAIIVFVVVVVLIVAAVSSLPYSLDRICVCTCIVRVGILLKCRGGFDRPYKLGRGLSCSRSGNIGCNFSSGCFGCDL